ncbi:hypothetical protein THAOC_22803, partial [Thalassiosira oceanica]
MLAAVHRPPDSKSRGPVLRTHLSSLFPFGLSDSLSSLATTAATLLRGGRGASPTSVAVPLSGNACPFDRPTDRGTAGPTATADVDPVVSAVQHSQDQPTWVSEAPLLASARPELQAERKPRRPRAVSKTPAAGAIRPERTPVTFATHPGRLALPRIPRHPLLSRPCSSGSSSFETQDPDSSDSPSA